MNMLSGARLNNVRKARQACSRQQSWQGLAMGFAQIQYRASHPAQAWAGMASPSLTFQGDRYVQSTFVVHRIK